MRAFIAHNVASPLRRKVIEAFQRYRTPLNMGIELPTIEAIKRFVAMGNGVALVPHLTVARELETGELVRVPVDELEMRRVLRLVHRRQATLSYAAKAFLNTLRTLAREQGPPFYYHVERAGLGTAAALSPRMRLKPGKLFMCDRSSYDPLRPFTMLRAGPRIPTGAPDQCRKSIQVLPAGRLCSS